MTLADVILVTVVVLLWLGLIALALRGWRKRGRAQAQQLGDFPAVPADVGEVLLGPTTGVYVGSTLAPRWATRVAVGDIGDRAAVELSRYRQGILLRRAGASPIWIPHEAITAVRTEHGLAGKVMTRDGVLVIRWRLPSGTELDSGVRADDKSTYPAWTAPYREITAATSADFHRPQTASTEVTKD
ncbi:MAG: transporter [Gordonia sp. (in: high G+C Gram-positive bacteria)]|uniref:PH-like domain-containing protein n=1 Tax=Gordonia sp. (in: high G+C Gram-positive bacteria) TaxID=84139 RepID=UPI003BB68077